MKSERKYYSRKDIAEMCGINATVLDYWMREGLSEITGLVRASVKNKHKMYNSRQVSMILKMAKLMKTGNYTIKGALTILKYQYA